jgi:hypothetical protein
LVGLDDLPKPPGTRLGVLFPVEGYRWIVTLIGWLGDHPPTDEHGFLEFAASLRVLSFDAIQDAESVSPIASHEFPSNRRRHHERMQRFPEGLVVLGDALCYERRAARHREAVKPREPNLIVSFFKPDKEVIGGATIALLDASEAPLRTGMWKKVTIDLSFDPISTYEIGHRAQRGLISSNRSGLLLSARHGQDLIQPRTGGSC